MKNYIKIKGKKTELTNELANKLADCIADYAGIIPCPIKFIAGVYGLMIPFGEKQVLYTKDGVYRVAALTDLNIVPCNLVPCKREDLEVDDLAFRSDEESPNFEYRSHYCKILTGTKYAYVSHNGGVDVQENRWKFWYKVVKA